MCFFYFWLSNEPRLILFSRYWGLRVNDEDFIVSQTVEVINKVVDFRFQNGGVGRRISLLGCEYFVDL